MSLIDLSKNEATLERSVKLARERKVIIPTLKQQSNPELIPAGIKERLKNIGLWDLNPTNLFRITWRNQPVATGGGFGGVNYHVVLESADTSPQKTSTSISARADLPLGLGVIASRRRSASTS